MTDDPYLAESFADLVNALPVFFGFVPRESVVGLTVKGDLCAFGFRLRHDLPDSGYEDALAADLAPHLVRNGGDGVLVIAISADRERAKTMAWALRDALPPAFRWLTLWVDDDRIWSDLPGDPEEGEPYVWSAHHESIVRAVANGQVILGDRSELEAEVSPPVVERNPQHDRVHDECVAQFVVRALNSPDSHDFIVAEQQSVARLVERALAGASLSDLERIELSVRVSPTRVRDREWNRIDRRNAAELYAVWSSVARLADAEVAPASLCLAGFAAWQWGDGARAMTALDRALRIEPDYRMAQLLFSALQAGMHPDLWSQAARSA